MREMETNKLKDWSVKEMSLLRRYNLTVRQAVPLRMYNVSEINVVLSFKDRYDTEVSAMKFLDNLGFITTDRGYRYIKHIIVENVEARSIPPFLSRMYEQCMQHFNVTRKAVENAVASALKAALNSDRFEKINVAFDTNLITNGHISCGHFLTTVISRFIVAKQYGKTISF